MVSSLRQLYCCQPFLLLPLLTSDYFAKLFEEVLKSRLTVKQLLASLSHILGGHLHGGRILVRRGCVSSEFACLSKILSRLTDRVAEAE